jgi:hypothetical protein
MESNLRIFYALNGQLDLAEEKSMAMMSMDSLKDKGIKGELINSFDFATNKVVLGGVKRDELTGEIASIRVKIKLEKEVFEPTLLISPEMQPHVANDAKLKMFAAACLKYGSLGCTVKKHQAEIEDKTVIYWKQYIYLLPPMQGEPISIPEPPATEPKVTEIDE